MMTSDLLSCVEVGPETDAEASVVWLHGLGASGHDFADVPPLLDLPRVRFVFPHAPNHPVTINMGLIMPAWFDVRRLRGHALEEGLASDEDERGIRDSAARVMELIERERRRGVAPGRVVVGGFSQGGAMALFVGARFPESLAGIMLLSGWEVLAATRQAEETEANRQTPLLVCHGRRDPMVPFEGGRRAYEAYARDGRPAEFHPFAMEHQVSMEEIVVIRNWLKRCLAPARPPEPDGNA